MPTLEQLTKSFVKKVFFISPEYVVRPNLKKSHELRKYEEDEDGNSLAPLDVRLLPNVIYDDKDQFKDDWVLKNTISPSGYNDCNRGLVKGLNGTICELAETITNRDASYPDRISADGASYRRVVMVKVSPSTGDVPIEVENVLIVAGYTKVESSHESVKKFMTSLDRFSER